MGIGSGGILAAADLSVQLVGQGRHIVIRIQVDVKDIFNCCLYFRPKVVAGRRIHELCSAEKILIVDGNEVRQRTCGCLRGVVCIAAFCGLIIICNGIVPVDVTGERYGLDLISNFRSDSIEVLQITAVGNAQNVLVAAVGRYEHTEHGVCIIKGTGTDVYRCLFSAGLEGHLCGNVYILTRVDVEYFFVLN